MDTTSKNAISQYLRDKTGLKIADISRNIGVSRKNLYEAINGRGSTKNRVEIAKLIGMPPSVLWVENDEITRTVDDLVYLKARQSQKIG